ncbi:MAG: hypothetical protein R6U35_06795 [Candidatus Humimicrobiaceae bacterium]
MKFEKFLEIYKDQPLIDSSTFPLYTKKPQILRVQVKKWKDKGKLLELKKGLYVFTEKYRKYNIPKLFIGNYLIFPSYISLEYALDFYNLIPERVNTVTSVTTKKTNRFKNSFGLFTYNTVKKDLFFGYEIKKTGREQIFFATPEKAIVDFLYINKNRISLQNSSQFFNSFRLQNLDILNLSSLEKISKLYTGKTKALIENLLEYISNYNKSFTKLEL